MRKIGFMAAGVVAGAGLAVLLALPQSGMSQSGMSHAVDTQGLHLLGILFVAAPVGALAGAVLALLAERVLRR